MASVRNPICKLLRKAARLLGPATWLRRACCLASRPGRRCTSAYRLSVGRNMMAKSVVWGGATYLLAISLACTSTARPRAAPAAFTPSTSAASWASIRRSYSSLG
ncbi:hypothetical protein G6F57_022076 [Rhizopus arrhizus]|nr:hypothetical protein G6F57_022076 [Rhizopus arrhizus]